MEPLILWGGTDISPSIYGQKPLKYTQQSDIRRDIEEEIQIERAIEQGRPIIGICRGAQFLCAKAGGSLYQHSTGHNKTHDVICKSLVNESKNFVIKNASAGHHQIMNVENTNHIIYGFANEETKVWVTNTDSKDITIQPEIVFFPDIKALAIQPHPEWMNKTHPFNIYISELIFKLLGVKNVNF